MRRFDFKLAKALEWRRLQERLAETALHQLQAELAAITGRIEGVAQERDQAGRSLASQHTVTGVELALLDSFREAAAAELVRLQSARADCQRRIDVQMAAVLERRRDARILVRLEEKQFAEWQADYYRELDQQASESHLARWNASNAAK